MCRAVQWERCVAREVSCSVGNEVSCSVSGVEVRGRRKEDRRKK
jgi:hypothetical protein